MKNISKFILISAAIIGLTAFSAIAQNVETFVAANTGNDANACTAISPCQTITTAISVTKAKGKIVLTENGVYETANLSKSLIITAAEGINATIKTTASAYIGLNITNLLDTDVVTISNIHFEEGGNSNFGIWSTSGQLFVDNCTFNGFGQAITKAGGKGLFVHHSTFRENFRGISVQPPINSATITATVDSSIFEINTTGFESVESVNTTITNSVFTRNTFVGIKATSPGNWLAKGDLFLDNCQINQNPTGVWANSTGMLGKETVRLSRSIITNNINNGVTITGLATTVYSLGNNVFAGNTTDVAGGVLTSLAAK